LIPLDEEAEARLNHAVIGNTLKDIAHPACCTEGICVNAMIASDILLHYADERAKLARTQYQWGCMSRRGTIAARVGRCQEKKFT
jgi:hypothetical protein